MTDPQPTIATNRSGEGVADAVNAHLAAMRAERVQAAPLAIATAYFNPGGFLLIADELEASPRVRLLLGAEPLPEPPPRRTLGEPLSPERALHRALEAGLATHDLRLNEDRDLLGFSHEADVAARRLIAWLGTDRVEVRRLTDRFLHGKAIIAEAMGGGTMVGSSNLTRAGLASNLELNLFRYDPEATNAVDGWFDDLWNVADPFDLAAVYANRFAPHDPFVVYLRMLWEQYAGEVEAIDENRGVGGIPLPTFSADAVWRALHHLDERGGVLLADDVGLGKTFQAGWLLEDRVLKQRKRALVIAPAVLRDGAWRAFVTKHQIPVQIVSFDELAQDRQLNPEVAGTHLWHKPNEYSLIVIDEAHNLRNPSTLRAEALRRLLAGAPPKEVVLITATPVNNSLMDLYHLLRFFIRSDAEFADVGVPSMREHFGEAMAKNPEDLTAEALFDILDQVSVRRTRPFIKRFYPNATIEIDGERVQVTFPTPRVKHVRYEFAEVLPGFFDDLESALDGYEYKWGEAAPDGVLSMARYVPSMYRLDRRDVEAHQVQNAGLLRSMLLKRFESSSAAFAGTCRKMATSHAGLVNMIQTEGLVATGGILTDWLAADDDEELDFWLETYNDELEDAADFDIERLCADLEQDEGLLLELAERAEALAPEEDPKLDRLVEELAFIAEQAALEGVDDKQQRNNRKVLLFSYFADTIDWIVDHLQQVCNPDSPLHDPRLAVYNGRIAAVSGSQDRSTAMFGFAPETTDAPPGEIDRFDLLVATDVLSEGVNLQQARHVINYDLPWNPQKVTQRHGRVDRLRSKHKEVFVRCFFPAKDLDRLLELEVRLERKMRQAIAVFGGHDWIDDRYVEVDFAENHEQIRLLQAEDNRLLVEGAAHALGGEEFRQQLRQVRDHADVMRRITELPYGAGSGFARAGGRTGWVFCARVADHVRPVFRYLPVDAVTWQLEETTDPETGEVRIIVEDKVLTCLAVAEPFPNNAPRVLPDDIAERAYDAWEAARSDIVDRWNWATDPANLLPRIPKAMRDAADLVTGNPDNALTVEQVSDLSHRLLDNYPARITRAFRAALRQTTPEAQLAEVRHLVEVFGLEPAAPIEPNKPIVAEDVRLVCWLAVSAAEEVGEDQ